MVPLPRATFPLEPFGRSIFIWMSAVFPQPGCVRLFRTCRMHVLAGSEELDVPVTAM